MSTLLSRMRLLQVDHLPDGWPAVKMQDISELCDELEKARATSQFWKDNHLAGNAEIERLREALTALCEKVEDTGEHGGDCHDDNCSVCAALASGRALIPPNASLTRGEAVALKR